MNNLATAATKRDLHDTKDEIINEMRKMQREVLDRIDKVINEIKDCRQNLKAHNQRHDDLVSIPIIAHELRKKR